MSDKKKEEQPKVDLVAIEVAKIKARRLELEENGILSNVYNQVNNLMVDVAMHMEHRQEQSDLRSAKRRARRASL